MKSMSRQLTTSGAPPILGKILPAEEIDRLEFLVRLSNCKDIASQLIRSNRDPSVAAEMIALRSELRALHARATSQYVKGFSLAAEPSKVPVRPAKVSASEVRPRPLAWIAMLKEAITWTR